MTMRRAPLCGVPLAVVAAAAMALLGCGREYVYLGPSSSDASAVDASSARTDAQCAPGLAMTGCSTTTMGCSSRSSCCSGRCDPALGDGPPVCLATCQGDGTSCTSAQACCSLACNNALCGGPLCLTANSMCSADADCCSSHCHMNRCMTQHDQQCLPTGEGCDPDADAGAHCCSGVCDQGSGRCDFGRGPCLDPSSPCGETDVICCGGAGACAPNGKGEMVCDPACLVDDTPCNFDGECCGGTCTGTPPLAVCSSLPACP